MSGVGNLKRLQVIWKSKRWNFVDFRKNLGGSADNTTNQNERGLPRLIFFGERHLQPDILAGQICLLEEIAKKKSALVMEWFSFDQQLVLNQWSSGDIQTIQDLKQRLEESKYQEGFDMDFYGEILKKARELHVPMFAGFVPRPVARLAIGSQDEEVAKKLKDFIHENYPSFDVQRFFFNQPGTKEHLEWFETMIRGEAWKRKDKSPSSTTVGDEVHGTGGFAKIFPAQVIKDASLANTTTLALSQYDHVLVCCGSGHSDYHFGGPERVDEESLVISPRTQLELDELMDNPESLDGNSGEVIFIYNHVSND